MEPQSGLPAPDSGKGGDGGGAVGPKNKLDDKACSMRSEGEGPLREGSPSINLGLGIGVGSGEPSHVIKQSKSAFTSTQLHELHQQALIFKYIVAGLPVPSNLVLPVWRSVESSFGSVNGGIYDQYPSFAGFSPQGFDYRGLMDPEPGRCRRTDGKKWRCSKNVVLDQKYCERHMHRGRQRSRKHVEASKIISESDTTRTADSNYIKTTVNSNGSTNRNSCVPISVPTSLQLMTPCSNTSKNVPATATSTITSFVSGNNGSNNSTDVNNDSSATPTTMNSYNRYNESNKEVSVNRETFTTTFISVAADHRNNSHYIDGRDTARNHFNNRNISRSSNNGKSGSLVASGVGFSPKNVLQVIGCRSSGLGYRAVTDTELQRCRRRDGKKWRCSRNVVPDQKYCELHMHRGAKRLSVASSVTIAVPAPSSNTCCPPSLAITKRVVDHINLNTSLSISVTASPQQMTHDENSSSSSSSSDATTITDENTSISDVLALSP